MHFDWSQSPSVADEIRRIACGHACRAFRRTEFHSSHGVDGDVSLRGVAAAHSRRSGKTI
jgi:hypothetical protein